MAHAVGGVVGLSARRVAGVIGCDGLLGERRGWEGLMWFGALIMMADSLLQAGVVGVLSKSAFHYIQGWPWIAALMVLITLYLYIHYGFASMTAQVTALYPGFLAAALPSGVNPLVAALSLAYFS